MKRIYPWLLAAAITVSLPFLYAMTESSVSGRTWTALPEDSLLKNNQVLDENRILDDLFLFPESDFDEKGSLEIVQTVANLPEHLQKQIKDSGIKIRLFSGELTDLEEAENLKGKLPRGYENKNRTWDDVPGMGGTETVLIKIGASDPGSGHGSVNLELHELAHSIDLIVYNGIRHDPSFRQIWKKEAPALFPGQAYFLEYPEEYFAEAFAMYYVNKGEMEHLKRKAPDTYLYISRLP